MKPHTFGPVQHTNAENDMPYQKCMECGKVMFLEGDDNFNMVCLKAVEKREDLRKRLEEEVKGR